MPILPKINDPHNDPHWEFFRAFTENGWEPIRGEQNHIDADDQDVYKLTVLAEYDIDVYAVANTIKRHLELDGQYGVDWINAHHEYEGDNRFLSWHDMDEMRYGIICAEKNLVTLGIPFVDGYEFHGDNAEWMSKQNKINRDLWELDRLQKEAEEEDD